MTADPAAKARRDKRSTGARPPAQESNKAHGSERERPRAPEPFEECGPTGGYGGAGMDDEAKNDT